MPKIDVQTWLLIFQVFTFLVTITGWIFTGGQQRSILRETRLYQRKDRDLVVYRTRMEKASELAKLLIQSSDKWYKLATLAKATLDEDRAQEFQGLALPIRQQAIATKTEMAIIFYDPQFRTLRDLLHPVIGKKLFDLLKVSSYNIDAFDKQTYNMLPTDADINEQVKFVYEEGVKIGDEIVDVANYLADAFAALDHKLTQESSSIQRQ